MFNLAVEFNNPTFQLGIVKDIQNSKKSKSKLIPLNFEWTKRTDAVIGEYKCIQHKGESREAALCGKHGEIWLKNESVYSIRVWSANLLKRNGTIRAKMRAMYGAYKHHDGDEGCFNISPEELHEFIEILKVQTDRGRQLKNAIDDHYRRRG